jgi:hypothetical protein
MLMFKNKNVHKTFLSNYFKLRIKLIFSILPIVVFFGFGFGNCMQHRYKDFSTVNSGQESSSSVLSPNNSENISQQGEPYPLSVKESVVPDSNCLNNTNFDACIFWKNPLAAKGSTYTSADLANIGQYQTIGVKLTGANAPTDYLETNAFKISLKWNPDQANTDKTIHVGQNTNPNRWRIDLNTDLQNKTYYIPQFTAYFYLNYQKEFMKTYAGNFFVESEAISSAQSQTNLFNNSEKKILVNAYDLRDSELDNNAFYSYSTDSILEGSSRNQQFKLMGNYGEVIVHEMGHANLFHANHVSEGFNNYTQQNVKFLACKFDINTQGCKANLDNKIDLFLIGRNQINETDYPQADWVIYTTGLSDGPYGNFKSINEGQADFHSNVIFRERPGVMESAINSVDSNRWVIRSPLNPSQKNWTATDFYQQANYNALTSSINEMVASSGSLPYNLTDLRPSDHNNSGKGECHDMGTLYSTILWEIYTNPDVNKSEFLNIFSEHLKMLTFADDFKSALRILLLVDSVHYDAKYRTIIRTAFFNRGINIDP